MNQRSVAPKQFVANCRKHKLRSRPAKSHVSVANRAPGRRDLASCEKHPPVELTDELVLVMNVTLLFTPTCFCHSLFLDYVATSIPKGETPTRDDHSFAFLQLSPQRRRGVPSCMESKPWFFTVRRALIVSLQVDCVTLATGYHGGLADNACRDYLENDVLATASSTERWALHSIQCPSSQPVPVAMRSTARASFQRYKAAVRLCHVRLHDPLSVITTPNKGSASLGHRTRFGDGKKMKHREGAELRRQQALRQGRAEVHAVDERANQLTIHKHVTSNGTGRRESTLGCRVIDGSG